MSEQAAPADEGGPQTPAAAGSEQAPGTVERTEPPYGDPADPYEKRYNDLRSWTDRVVQDNADLRSQQDEWRQQQEYYALLLESDDPETRRAAAEALGYMLADEEPEPESTDPLTAYGARLERLEQSLAERDQERDDDAYASQVRAIVDERLDALGIDKDDQDWVLAYAINALPITEEGLPDVAQAFQVFQARETERQKKWAQSKRAPRISPDGQPATEVPNLDNRQERQDFVMRRMLENEQAGY